MKLCGLKKSISRQRGITIMEMLAYIILCAGFLTLAYRTVTVSSQEIIALHDNAYDIIRVTKAGERWRQDIREAVSSPVTQSQELDSPPRAEQITREDGVEGFDGNPIPEILPLIPETQTERIQITYLIIEKASKTIWYAFRQGKVYRQDSLLPDNWELILKDVATSNMASESRGEAAAWRWELELKTARQDTLTRPLFSFLAVSRKGQKP
tara:strand:+ start:880 stop:1512 length:633 start_codon:yes stop_codon:yes gene_type:complete